MYKRFTVLFLTIAQLGYAEGEAVRSGEFKMDLVTIDGKEYQKYRTEEGVAKFYLPSVVDKNIKIEQQVLCPKNLGNHKVVIVQENASMEDANVSDAGSTLNLMMACALRTAQNGSPSKKPGFKIRGLRSTEMSPEMKQELDKTLE
ncbi:MAG: hypothetical protein AB7T49_01210 [Oligoflexales bacterium]